MQGEEASFSALASAPIFAAQVPVGLLSGYLVSTYLSEDRKHPDGQTLWLIIALVTLSSPLLITVCEKWIREPVKKKAAKHADEVVERRAEKEEGGERSREDDWDTATV